MEGEDLPTISYIDYKILSTAGFIIDGSKGGLVLGPSHEEGGVKILHDYGDCYRVTGEMEGFEFVFNHAAAHVNRNNHKELNAHDMTAYDLFEPYVPPGKINIIDARLDESLSFIKNISAGKYVVFENRQAIFNRQATKDRLEELNFLNQRFTFKYDNEILKDSTKGFLIDTEERKVFWEYQITKPRSNGYDIEDA